MGISSISSYRGSQLFEIVGLGKDIVDLCFTTYTELVVKISVTLMLRIRS